MNLILDFGNSATKIIIYDNYEIVLSEKMYYSKNNYFTKEVLQNLLVQNPQIKKIIVSSVVELGNELTDYIKKLPLFSIFLGSETPLPVKINYKTPRTLGKDRIAAVVGAHYLQPNCNCLVIDIGTAITFDIVTSRGEFIGGNISPGPVTRFKALNTFTGKLPLIKEIPEFNGIDIGLSTTEAIIYGVLNSVYLEIIGYIDYFELNYSQTIIFLTGGDANLFVKQLKNTIFAEPNLVAYGLNRILEYNE